MAAYKCATIADVAKVGKVNNTSQRYCKSQEVKDYGCTLETSYPTNQLIPIGSYYSKYMMGVSFKPRFEKINFNYAYCQFVDQLGYEIWDNYFKFKNRDFLSSDEFINWPMYAVEYYHENGGSRYYGDYFISEFVRVTNGHYHPRFYDFDNDLCEYCWSGDANKRRTNTYMQATIDSTGIYDINAEKHIGIDCPYYYVAVNNPDNDYGFRSLKQTIHTMEYGGVYQTSYGERLTYKNLNGTTWEIWKLELDMPKGFDGCLILEFNS